VQPSHEKSILYLGLKAITNRFLQSGRCWIINIPQTSYVKNFRLGVNAELGGNLYIYSDYTSRNKSKYYIITTL
jgi:hypothetical protein